MLEILQSRRQIQEARRALRRRGLSSLDDAGTRVLRRLGIIRYAPVGDYLKSWDVAKTVNFVEARLSRGAAVLDLGAFGSETPFALTRLGYDCLYGIDLSAKLETMPSLPNLRYVVGDYLNSGFLSGSFEAITAISAVEHDYQPHRLFPEVSRLLRLGGYFILSFDYWPTKTDTGDMRLFGMPWTIFSESDLREMLANASGSGLVPVGDLHMQIGKPVVHCMGFDYTFAWLALEKVR